MALIICNAGAISLLTLMLKTALLVDETYTLHLYQNNVTPTHTSVAGDFTECTFTNYTSISLARATWITPTTVGLNAQTQYGNTPLTWTCGTTGNTVYGAYILDGSNNLVWAEQFSQARTLVNGDTLNYTPVFTFVSAN